MIEILDAGGYWLPEDHTLHLTALEMGQLLMLVYLSPSTMKVNKPGPNGEPIPTTMRARLLEKIQDAIEERYAANEKKKSEAAPQSERALPG